MIDAMIECFGVLDKGSLNMKNFLDTFVREFESSRGEFEQAFVANGLYNKLKGTQCSQSPSS